MTRVTLPYVHEYIDVRGKVRRQFRRKGFKKAPLPGVPGSPEFMDAYRAAMEGTVISIVPGGSRTKAGSISALVVRYYGSAEWKALADSTKTTYRGIIERFRAEHGDKPVALMERRHVKVIIDKKANTPAAANSLLRIIRVLMQFAIVEEIRRDDPTLGVKPVTVKTDGFYTWSDEDIAKFEAKYPIGTRARLAMALLLYTGQRRSDVIRMGRQHVRDGFISVRQKKTGTYLEIPIHPELRRVLDSSPPSDHLTFLIARGGRPFTEAGFGNWIREICDAAGLPDCSSHGLRKAACRRMAEAGCTPSQIMAISGHKSLKEVTTYTAAAEQKHLARQAMSNVIGINREQPVANMEDALATALPNPLKLKEK